MKSRIIGTGSCLPAAKVTNDWLSTKMDTSDEWIVSRTGIRERRIAREETTTDMAEQGSQAGSGGRGELLRRIWI